MTAVRFDLQRSCIGGFRVHGGQLRIGDPCCSPFEVEARPGTWLAFREHGPLGIWGERNTRLLALHEDFLGYHSETIEERPLHCTVGVDAGFVAIVDASQRFTVEDALNDGLNDAIVANGRGAAVSSGFGDGGYDAMVCRRNEAAVFVEVEFIDDATVRSYQQTLPTRDEVPGTLRPPAERVRFQAINASGPPVEIWLARPLEDLELLTPYGINIGEHRNSLWEVIELGAEQHEAVLAKAYGRTPALMSDGVRIFILGEFEGHRGLWTTHGLVREGAIARESP